MWYSKDFRIRNKNKLVCSRSIDTSANLGAFQDLGSQGQMRQVEAIIA